MRNSSEVQVLVNSTLTRHREVTALASRGPVAVRRVKPLKQIKPKAKDIVEFLAMVTQQWPKLAGSPELAALPMTVVDTATYNRTDGDVLIQVGGIRFLLSVQETDQMSCDAEDDDE